MCTRQGREDIKIGADQGTWCWRSSSWSTVIGRREGLREVDSGSEAILAQRGKRTVGLVARG